MGKITCVSGYTQTSWKIFSAEITFWCRVEGLKWNFLWTYKNLSSDLHKISVCYAIVTVRREGGFEELGISKIQYTIKRYIWAYPPQRNHSYVCMVIQNMSSLMHCWYTIQQSVILYLCSYFILLTSYIICGKWYFMCRTHQFYIFIWLFWCTLVG